MSVVAFDSLRVARQLVAAGFTQQQAEAAVDAAVQATTELANKSDMREMEQRLFNKVGALFIGVAAAAVMSLFWLLRTFPGGTP